MRYVISQITHFKICVWSERRHSHACYAPVRGVLVVCDNITVTCTFWCSCVSLVVGWKRNLMAHGDAREEKWRGKRRMEWVASSLQFDSEQSIQCYYNRFPPTRTPRKPVLDWTDTPADLNGLVRFAGRPDLVSARVPSRSVFTLLFMRITVVHATNRWRVPSSLPQDPICNVLSD